MDFWDMSKPFTRIKLKGGQTQGYVKENCAFTVQNSKVELKSGTEYVQEHVLKEKQKYLELNEKDIDEGEVDLTEGYMTDLCSVGSFSDLGENRNEQCEQVFGKYFKPENEGKNDLAICTFKSKILSLVDVNQVTVISGPTGCGKTTKVPQFILDSYAKNKKFCNIIVSQPRRLAAITITKRICQERGWQEGSICGFKVGLLENTSTDTRLTFVTVGVLLQILLHKKNMNNFTHVIIDEIHERDQDTDFTLLVVKQFLYWNSRNVKVILMSATAETAKFANYFESPICGELQPAPVFNIDEPNKFSIDIHYLEELSGLGKLPVIDLSDPTLSELHVTIGIKLIKHIELLDPEKKSVLVFLPGIYDIEMFYDKLRDPKIYEYGNSEYKWHCVPLHSTITLEEQRLAFRPPPTGYRKIILCTNIAESSITVPDVMFVIDYCLTKVLVTDPESNFTCLQLSWASKANLIQRAGRAGRVMNGSVYRMIYRDIYNDLEEHSTPGMLRCPLERVVLQSKILDIGPPKAVLALAIDPPDLRNIGQTILILKEVGGLLVTKGGKYSEIDGDLTFLGRLMADLPVDIHITKLICLGFVYNCLEECIIMGAAMSTKNVFCTPFQAQMKSYNAKLKWADGSCSDSIAFLNVYEVWKMNQRDGYFKRSDSKGESNWAKRQFIQLRALNEVQVLIDEITKRLKINGIESSTNYLGVQWTDIEKSLVLKFLIAGAFYPNYFTRSASCGQIDEREAVRTLCGNDPFNTVYLKNYPAEQPPDLYSNLIAEKMSVCHENMKITYDGSKVFIHFHENELAKESSLKVPGRISTAVYRAVKMREIMKNVEIHMLPLEEARKKANLIQIQKREEIFSVKASKSETVTNKMYQSVLPGIDVRHLPITVTYVVNPTNFWAVQKDLITIKHERNVFRCLNVSNADLHEFSCLPEIGEICAAPYEFETMIYLYRARIDSINRNEAEVFFIDFGNRQVVSLSKLRRFGPRVLEVIQQIPGQAFKCKLTKVQPSIRRSVGGQWCDGAKKRFDNLVSVGTGKELIGSIYSVVSGVVSLVLHKPVPGALPNEANYININQKLIEEGFAEETEETYLSKMNNDIRRERDLNEDQRIDYNVLQTQKMWTKLPPVKFLNTLGRIPVALHGPFSPLEMKVCSSTSGGRRKLTKIVSTSVNSILLDSDPQDPHERLIVAGHVGKNQSGSTLILRHTTVMPNIHGLSAIIPFVFAPTVELRVNRARTAYTGFLCGLGTDEFGRSLFPEHEMEIVFDCEFTMEDVVTVNKLRYATGNLLMGVGYPEPIQGFPDFVAFQDSIKENFTKLINKQRQSVEPEFPEKEFQWNVVEADVLMSDVDVLRLSKKSIYPIHNGVSLKCKNQEKKKLLENLTHLKEIVQKRDHSVALPIFCELCELELKDLNFLSLHLASTAHEANESKLHST